MAAAAAAVAPDTTESPLVQLFATDLKWEVLSHLGLEELAALILAVRALSAPFVILRDAGRGLDLERALAFYSRTCRVRLEQLVHRDAPVPRVLAASPAFRPGVARALVAHRDRLVKRWAFIRDAAAARQLPPVQRRAARRIAWNLAIIAALGPLAAGGGLRRALCQRLGRGDAGQALLQAAKNDRGDVIRHVLLRTFQRRQGREAWAEAARAASHDAAYARGYADILNDAGDQAAVARSGDVAQEGYDILFMLAVSRCNVNALAALRDMGVATGMDRSFPALHSRPLIEYLLKTFTRGVIAMLSLLHNDWGVPRGVMVQEVLSLALEIRDATFVEYLRREWGLTDRALCDAICHELPVDNTWLGGSLWVYLCSVLPPELTERLAQAEASIDYGWAGAYMQELIAPQ